MFDTEGLDFIAKYETNPILNRNNFSPRGGTPLRDAIFWQSEDVARAIQHFQDQYGWKFSFIGCGQTEEVIKYAKSFNINEKNIVSCKEKEDLVEAFSHV